MTTQPEGFYIGPCLVHGNCSLFSDPLDGTASVHVKRYADLTEQRAEILTVGGLRAVLNQTHLTDDCRIAVAASRTYDARNTVLTPVALLLQHRSGLPEYHALVRVWDQASDAYPLPFGTDPAEESTISVLIIEVTP